MGFGAFYPRQTHISLRTVLQEREFVLPSTRSSASVVACAIKKCKPRGSRYLNRINPAVDGLTIASGGERIAQALVRRWRELILRDLVRQLRLRFHADQ